MPRRTKPPSFADGLARAAEEGTRSREQRKADDPYTKWQESRSPEDLYRVVEQHRPTIDRAVASIVPTRNPLAQRRALLLAAQAVESYDPKRGVPLKHHIQSQLSGLRRYTKQVTEAVPIPERVRRDTARLQQATEELWGTLDREPTDIELADHTGITLKQQRRLRQRQRVATTEGYLQSLAGEGDGAEDFLPGVSRPSLRGEIEDYVVFDLDPVDRLIYQHRTGYGGADILPNQDIAKRVKLSPGAVTQRMNKIENRIQELMNA